jgi:hypothetical protein
MRYYMRATEGLFMQVYLDHGGTNPREKSKFPAEFHFSVDMWLAGVEGLQRGLEFALGRSIFAEAFYCLTFEYLTRMRLNWWQDDWAYLPYGKPLNFEHELQPPFEVRRAAHIDPVLHRAVAVQNRVSMIDRTHPGKWSPMFQERVRKWLVHVENIIRCLDWIMENRPEGKAFYLIDDRSRGELDQALHGRVQPASINQLLGITQAPMDMSAKDYE